MLSEMLEQQSHSRDDASNPYLTHDDFDRLRELEGRVRDLRNKANCRDFVAESTSLLAEEASRYAGCSAELKALIDCWRNAEQRHLSTIRSVTDSLAFDLHVCVRANPSHALKAAFEQMVPQLRVGQQPPMDDLATALESFRADEERLASCVATMKSSLNALTESARDLVRRCREEIPVIRAMVVERRVIVEAGDLDADAKTDLGTLEAQGKQYAFLTFTTPPKLTQFECDSALGLYLNVAEDVVDGAIRLRESRLVNTTYKAFMEAVTSVDRLLSEALSLERICSERVARAEAFHEVVARELTGARLDEAAAVCRGSLVKARALLVRAQQLAAIGDISMARHLQSVATKAAGGLVTADTVDAAIAEQAARSQAMQLSFGQLETEAVRQSSMWRLTWHEFFPFLGAHQTLRELLDEFFSLHRETRWGPGSTLCQSFVEMVRQCRPWCDLVGYKPSLRSWALLHDRMTRCERRDVHPTFAFNSALCAMAHAHDGLSEEEAALIKSIARDRAIAMDSAEFDKLVQRWRGLPRDQQTLEAIAQAILDVHVITDPAMLEALMQGLRRVAQADGDLASDELAVYHGFVTTISRRMYPTFSE
jgi:hypothetical protein